MVAPDNVNIACVSVNAFLRAAFSPHRLTEVVVQNFSHACMAHNGSATLLPAGRRLIHTSPRGDCYHCTECLCNVNVFGLRNKTKHIVFTLDELLSA